MKYRRLLLVPLFVVILIGGLASDRTVAPYAKWLAGDFHEHSYFTDGSIPIRGVVRNAFRYGLHWVANSEHGGTSLRNDEGAYWDDPEVYTEFPAKGDPTEITRENRETGEKVTHKRMWRWQTLTDYVWPVILELRGEYPERLVASGLEWNVPGHEHCSVGIVDRDASLLSEFEYRFDRGDTDRSGGPDGKWTGKNHTDGHAKAVEAVVWMRENRPKTSWIVFAHPERVSSFTAADFRDFNDAAPDIAFGFEGLPGHQKVAQRGGYRERAVGGGTYGGAGAYIAEVGGLWDALLGEGRHWWNFVSSDFHSPSGDFWPGEYAKTWTRVQDLDRDGRYTLEEVAAGLRSGNSYAVHGDLIDQLDFSATSAVDSATMGETLRIKHNGPMSLNISFRVPETNYNGDEPKVRLIQVIAGEVHDPAPKFLADGTTPNPAFAKETNDTAQIVAVFREDELEYERAGWYRAPEFKVDSLRKDMYYRIRGTNLPPDTPNETDAEGSPLADAIAREDLNVGRVEAAWKDLWFYSNPIFVEAVE
jgi:hypothetical protein